jgi:hypothetical protein
LKEECNGIWKTELPKDVSLKKKSRKVEKHGRVMGDIRTMRFAAGNRIIQASAIASMCKEASTAVSLQFFH